MKKINLNTECRFTAEEMEERYHSIEELSNDNRFKQCSVCGFFYEIEDGFGELSVDGEYFEDVCPDCGDLLQSNLGVKIPYFDEMDRFEELCEVDEVIIEDEPSSYYDFKFNEAFDNYKQS